MTESMCSVFPNLDAHKEMFLNRAGARQPWTKGRVIAAHRHGRYARLAESENRAVPTMALVPATPWFQSGTACQSFRMLDEGLLGGSQSGRRALAPIPPAVEQAHKHTVQVLVLDVPRPKRDIPPPTLIEIAKPELPPTNDNGHDGNGSMGAKSDGNLSDRIKEARSGWGIGPLARQ